MSKALVKRDRELEKLLVLVKKTESDFEKLEKDYEFALDGKNNKFPIIRYLTNLFSGHTALDRIKTEYEKRLKSTEQLLIELGKTAVKSKDDLVKLKDFLDTPGHELGDYISFITEEIDVSLDESILTLIDEETKYIDDKVKDETKEKIHAKLESALATGIQLYSTLEVCAVGLIETFKETAVDYFIFKQYLEPLKKIQGTSEEISKHARMVQPTKELVLNYISKSKDLLIASSEALEKLREYRLGAPGTAKEITEQITPILEKAKELDYKVHDKLELEYREA